MKNTISFISLSTTLLGFLLISSCSVDEDLFDCDCTKHTKINKDIFNIEKVCEEETIQVETRNIGGQNITVGFYIDCGNIKNPPF